MTMMLVEHKPFSGVLDFKCGQILVVDFEISGCPSSRCNDKNVINMSSHPRGQAAYD
jgi:hypothetical protein